MKWILSLLILFSQAAVANKDEFKKDLEQFIHIHKTRAEFLFAQRSEITGLEIIVADRANNMASRFGHALLRFVDKDGLWANDIVISFGALSDTEKLSLVKGVFGGYPILPEVMTLHEYWNRYTQVESRDLRRYVLNLDKKQLDHFLDITFEYVKNPEKLKNYTFTKNNCVGVISKFLIEAGLTVDDKQAIVPTRVHKWLRKNNLTIYPEFVMKNPSLLEKKISEVQLASLKTEELIQKFSAQELAYIYINKEDLSFNQIKGISSYLNESQINIDDAFSVTNLSPLLYQRCHSLECFRNFNKLEQNLKIEEQLNIIGYRLKENNDQQRLYLAHREFQKWDLIRVQGLHINDGKYKLTLKKNKIHFSANAIKTEQAGTQKVSTPLQFEVNAKTIILLGEEVGQIKEGALLLKDNFRFVLHQDGEDQVFSLIKI